MTNKAMIKIGLIVGTLDVVAGISDLVLRRWSGIAGIILGVVLICLGFYWKNDA